MRPGTAKKKLKMVLIVMCLFLFGKLGRLVIVPGAAGVLKRSRKSTSGRSGILMYKEPGVMSSSLNVKYVAGAVIAD